MISPRAAAQPAFRALPRPGTASETTVTGNPTRASYSARTEAVRSVEPLLTTMSSQPCEGRCSAMYCKQCGRYFALFRVHITMDTTGENCFAFSTVIRFTPHKVEFDPCY